MKITEKELKEMIRAAVKAKLNEAVTDKKEKPPQEWVAYLGDVDSFVKETIEKAKELVAKAEEIKDKEIEKDDATSSVKPSRASQYDLVNHRLQFVKNLVTKLSAVDFDQSESYYKGKL